MSIPQSLVADAQGNLVIIAGRTSSGDYPVNEYVYMVQEEILTLYLLN